LIDKNTTVLFISQDITHPSEWRNLVTEINTRIPSSVRISVVKKQAFFKEKEKRSLLHFATVPKKKIPSFLKPGIFKTLK
jgi:hypothetical protein